jgi:hypothetical protein
MSEIKPYKEIVHMFQAECHCGNMKMSATRSPLSVTRCNCSICYRLGAIWAYYDSAEVAIQTGNSPVITYAWGEKSITFHHCSKCGCATHYTTTESDSSELTAINIRMAPASITDSIPVRDFDGAVSWKYVDE